MNQPSFIEAMTGVKSESQAEMSARELREARALAALLVARVVVLSAWGVVFLAAMVILAGVAVPREQAFDPWPAVVMGLVFALVALFVGVGAFGERRKP